MARFFLLAIFFVQFNFGLLAQDSTLAEQNWESEKYAHFSECLQEVFNKADLLKDQTGEEAEIEWLKNSRITCGESSPVTRRISVKYLEWGDTIYDDKGVKENVDKKELFKMGLEWGRKALKEDSLDHLNYENLSMAFAAVISVSGLKGKANMADSVRVFAEKAIALDPGNHRAYHILGRWHYEVSKLSWLTRTLSRLVFGDSPSGSFERSIGYFEEAISLKNMVVHHYWLGMAYLESGNKAKALEEFKLLQNLPIYQHNDPFFKNEAKKLIEKHS